MDALTSTEFRKQYAGLSEPTVVTVNGHPIGTWTPMRPMEVFAHQMGKLSEAAKEAGRVIATSQAKRDDLLRKINRGKG